MTILIDLCFLCNFFIHSRFNISVEQHEEAALYSLSFVARRDQFSQLTSKYVLATLDSLGIPH